MSTDWISTGLNPTDSKSFELVPGTFSFLSDETNPSVGRRLRDHPIETRRILRLKPHMRRTGAASLWKLDHPPEQRRRLHEH